MQLLKSVLHNTVVITVGMGLVWMGCGKDRISDNLAGCCQEPAIQATVGNGHLYVANIFTPNGDGINDLLWVYADNNILIIRSFQVRDKEGQLVYQVLDGIPNDISDGWDGMVNGKYVNGVYAIALQAEAADGTIANLEGKACNFRCLDMNIEDPISMEGCQFPAQVVNGMYDPFSPSQEHSGCFE